MEDDRVGALVLGNQMIERARVRDDCARRLDQARLL